MTMVSIQIVLFDMAGTTVNDRAVGKSMVVDAMIGAFSEAGVAVTGDQIVTHRGKPKREAIFHILAERNASGYPAPQGVLDTVYRSFLSRLRDSVDKLEEMTGVSAVFQSLKSNGIRIGVGSGFPEEIVYAIVDRFGWQQKGLIDYVGTVEKTGAGRPDPKMIYDIMAQFSVSDPRAVMKVGDTEMDILEGKNAGVWTVGVLSGTQPRERLAALEPDFLVDSIRCIPGLIGKGA